MKIGIDSRAAKWYRGTGIGTYTYQLINSLNKIDLFNEYLLFMPNYQSCNINFNDNYKIKNITQNLRNNFWDEINIPNILKNKDIDLYHIPQNGIGLPNEKTCPFVITLHDIIPYKMPETVGERYLDIFLKKMPKIISMCDGIITVSEFSKKDIIEAFNYPKEKIFVTHLANEDIYIPLNKKRCRNFLSKKYSIKNKYILYVGGFSPRKNIVGLIKAFSKLLDKSKNKDINLVIVGQKGKSYSLYKETAENMHISDKVIFPGFIPLKHMPIFYNGCSLFVYPSLYEGFGLPLVEAMACGVPIIASNLTSIPEVMDDAGILINPYDVDQLSKAMENALLDKNLRKSLIDKSLKRIKKFSWIKTAQSTLTSFKNIIKTYDKI